MTERNLRIDTLHAAIKERILFLDGAMGTVIQQYKLVEGDYRGQRLAAIEQDQMGNNDILNLTRPDCGRRDR